MGLASRADALALLVQTAVGSSVAVLIGVDPAKIAGEDYPEFVCIVPTGARYEENALLNDIAQEAVWTWSLYVGIGSGGIQEDALDRCDIYLESLISGLQGERIDTGCDELELVERHEFEGWRPGGGVVYRQDWQHGAFAD